MMPSGVTITDTLNWIFLTHVLYQKFSMPIQHGGMGQVLGQTFRKGAEMGPETHMCGLQNLHNECPGN